MSFNLQDFQQGARDYHRAGNDMSALSNKELKAAVEAPPGAPILPEQRQAAADELARRADGGGCRHEGGSRHASRYEKNAIEDGDGDQLSNRQLEHIIHDKSTTTRFERDEARDILENRPHHHPHHHSSCSSGDF